MKWIRNLSLKVKIEIVVSLVPVQKVIETAKKVLHTGQIGDPLFKNSSWNFSELFSLPRSGTYVRTCCFLYKYFVIHYISAKVQFFLKSHPHTYLLPEIMRKYSILQFSAATAFQGNPIKVIGVNHLS